MNSLNCKILAKKGDKVEAEIGEQKIDIPIKCLPNSVQVGDILQIYFLEKEKGLTDKKMAKTILEEILNGK